MSNQPTKKVKSGRPAARSRHNRKSLLWSVVTIAVAFELFLYFTHKPFTTIFGIPMMVEALGTLIYVLPAVLAVCAVVWFVLRKRENALTRLFAALTAFFFLLSVWALLTNVYYDKAIKFLALFVGAALLLTLIYMIYQREFFFCALVDLCGLAALFIYRRSMVWGILSTRVLVVFIVGMVLLTVCIILALHLRNTRGLLQIGERKLRLLPSTAGYQLLLLTAALVLALLICSLLLGMMVAYFGMFILAACFFVLAVYYTVRLM